jgi:hypothetical protein
VNLLAIVGLTIFLVVWDVAMLLGFRAWGYKRGHREGSDDGYKRGYEKGLSQGRIVADNWWMNVEQQVDYERLKIWKEGIES